VKTEEDIKGRLLLSCWACCIGFCTDDTWSRSCWFCYSYCVAWVFLVVMCPNCHCWLFALYEDTAGSCSMLPRDKQGVVSPELIVYGTKNLRVVDLSIVPLQFAAHPQGAYFINSYMFTIWWRIYLATVYVIAEKGKGLLRCADCFVLLMIFWLMQLLILFVVYEDEDCICCACMNTHAVLLTILCGTWSDFMAYKPWVTLELYCTIWRKKCNREGHSPFQKTLPRVFCVIEKNRKLEVNRYKKFRKS
jgi:hypothetical protein